MAFIPSAEGKVVFSMVGIYPSVFVEGSDLCISEATCPECIEWVEGSTVEEFTDHSLYSPCSLLFALSSLRSSLRITVSVQRFFRLFFVILLPMSYELRSMSIPALTYKTTLCAREVHGRWAVERI